MALRALDDLEPTANSSRASNNAVHNAGSIKASISQFLELSEQDLELIPADLDFLSDKLFLL